MMCSCNSKDSRLWWGLVAFVVGGVVLLERLGVVPMGTWDYLWPSILALNGVRWMISGDGNNSCEGVTCNDCGDMNCSCDVMPMATHEVRLKKRTPSKKRS